VLPHLFCTSDEQRLRYSVVWLLESGGFLESVVF
jgi:hypothetical protein